MGVHLGERAAVIYGVWAFFLFLGCAGPHLLVAGLYLRGWARSPSSRWLLLTEFIYGFINPVVYLLVFQPALFRRWTPGWLVWLCWLGWILYWSARLFGAGRTFGRTGPRAWAGHLLRFTVVLLAGVIVRDGIAALRGALIASNPVGLETGAVLAGPLCLPLYALPFMAALRQLLATRSDEAWAASGFFITKLPAWVPFALLASLGVGIFSTFPRSTDAEIRALLLEHRATIISESRERNLDPRLLASIVEVTQRDLNPPFHSALEDFVTTVWLSDRKSGWLLAEALDPSLGISQVKAHTVLTACAIRALSSPNTPNYLSKDYRSVRALDGESLERIPTAALLKVRPPSEHPLPDKKEVVEALRTPAGNLLYATFLLDLVATQWEGANTGWAIRSRPDIMATLFQLGFAHSLPKASPTANDFGRHVQDAFNEPWMSATFGPDAN